MNRLWLFFVAAILFLSSASLHAQSGCVNSPENPTAILALAGTAGAGISYLRAGWKARGTK